MNNVTFNDMNDTNSSGLMFCSGTEIVINATDVVFPEGENDKNRLQFDSGTTLNLSGNIEINSNMSCQNVVIDENTNLKISDESSFTYASLSIVDSNGNPSQTTLRTIIRNSKSMRITFDFLRLYK